MSSSHNSLYFPNLNGVRFIAAFWVIVHHIEQFKEKFGFANHIFYTRFIRQLGPLGVFLFFVLSGFLITTLLLLEKQKTNTIDIKKFYLRRILRIWPLYYFIVILGLFVLPQIEFLNIPDETPLIGIDLTQKIVLYALILPNIVTGVFKHIPFVSQNWSIGVEEQFYYFWPWVIRQSKTTKLLSVMVFFLVFFYLLRSLTVLYMPENGLWIYLKEFIKSLRLTCMILGAIGAYFTHFQLNSKIVQFIFKPIFQGFLYVLLSLMLYFEFYQKGLSPEIYSLVFTLILMNLAKNPKTILSLENPVLDYLGKISYGLYMYHTIAVVIAVKIAFNHNQSNWISYSVTLILTIIMAGLSYQYFEKPFLKLKDKFAVVKSGKKLNN
jgi:peptidoglycan/LPS O-acetylase OafA/YrhL